MICRDISASISEWVRLGRHRRELRTGMCVSLSSRMFRTFGRKAGRACRRRFRPNLRKICTLGVCPELRVFRIELRLHQRPLTLTTRHHRRTFNLKQSRPLQNRSHLRLRIYTNHRSSVPLAPPPSSRIPEPSRLRRRSIRTSWKTWRTRSPAPCQSGIVPCSVLFFSRIPKLIIRDVVDACRSWSPSMLLRLAGIRCAVSPYLRSNYTPRRRSSTDEMIPSRVSGGCVHEWFRDKDTCPICRTSTSTPRMVPLLPMDRMIDMYVRAQGEEWEGLQGWKDRRA